MGRINDLVVMRLDEVQRALAPYDVGQPLDLNLCASGIINTNYVVRTQAANYLLRVYNEDRDRDGIEFEISILRRLAGHGFPCQRPVADQSGAYIGSVNGRHFALLSYVEGEVLEREQIDARICSEVGNALAEMQNVLDGFAPEGKKPDADYALIRQLAELQIERLRGLGASARAAAEEVAGDWRELAPIFAACSFPKGIVHADIYYQNVIVRGGRLAGIIDFDDAYLGVLLYDLALILMEFSIKEEGRMDLALVEATLGAFLAKRPLPRRQLDALYDAMRFLCFKYLGYTAELAEFQGQALLSNGYLQRLDMLRQSGLRAQFQAIVNDCVARSRE